MFIDGLLLFDPAGTAITVSAASTNILDMVNSRDMGLEDGNSLSIFIAVQQAFVAAGAATLQASLQGAVDNGGVPGTWFDYIMTGALPKANLTVGREVLRASLPMNQPAASNTDTPPRFYRLNYTVATGPFTAGTVIAALIPTQGRQANIAYASGFNAAN